MSNLLKLNRVQNKAMIVILRTTKDTPVKAMRYLLDLPSMEARHKVEQVKAYITAMQNPKDPLHNYLLTDITKQFMWVLHKRNLFSRVICCYYMVIVLKEPNPVTFEFNVYFPGKVFWNQDNFSLSSICPSLQIFYLSIVLSNIRTSLVVTCDSRKETQYNFFFVWSMKMSQFCSSCFDVLFSCFCFILLLALCLERSWIWFVHLVKSIVVHHELLSVNIIMKTRSPLNISRVRKRSQAGESGRLASNTKGSPSESVADWLRGEGSRTYALLPRLACFSGSVDLTLSGCQLLLLTTFLLTGIRVYS